VNAIGGLGDLAVEVRDLTVSLASGQPIVESVSLEVAAGQTLGIIGESGSGKTTLGLALLGYARPGAKITAGSVLIGAQEMLGKPEEEVRRLRGRTVGYVPQDPATALIPSLRVDQQISELQRIHLKQQDPVARDELLQLVHLPSDRPFRRRYPHQLSGGQQQRLAIALALVSRPQVLVLDEPTTGLDVVTQEHILESIVQIQSETGVAILYVSHNLAVVASVVHRVAVMYAGRIVEESEATPRFFGHPRHPYAAGLIASVPDHRSPRQLHGLAGIAVSVTDRPAGCAFEPRCPQRTPRCATEMPILEEIGSGHEVRCFEWRVTPEISVEDRPLDRIASGQYTCLSVEELSAQHRSRHGTVVAAASVSFSVQKGECLALVGESGSGKTTIARCIAGLHRPSGGTITLDGAVLAPIARERTQSVRKRLQIVFQNPYDSLNPRHTVRQAILRAMKAFETAGGYSSEDLDFVLDSVRLPRRVSQRYPAELSGGERQRVALARALAAKPELIICDEITSALDVSIQAAVIDLLVQLRASMDLSLLFITHDLGVVASIADRVVVLEQGVICESGPVEQVLNHPSDPYTQRLVGSAPVLDLGRRDHSDPASISAGGDDGSRRSD
jgi:peptide/nickel transport system ATP-binding protein